MMANTPPPVWVYNETIKMFATPGDPPFEDRHELETHWGRAWGINNDVGRMRSVLVHRPGKEMDVIDPKKRPLRPHCSYMVIVVHPAYGHQHHTREVKVTSR